MTVMTSTAPPLEADWRFAGLIAQALAEPELGGRYAADPHAVLAEYGLFLGAGQDAPDLPEFELIVEHLDPPSSGGRVGVCVHDAAYARVGVCVNDAFAPRTGVCVQDLAYGAVGVCVQDLGPAPREGARAAAAAGVRPA